MCYIEKEKVSRYFTFGIAIYRAIVSIAQHYVPRSWSRGQTAEDLKQIPAEHHTTISVNSGPALGMFEVFGRTGPQSLGEGAQFRTLQKLTCQFERLYGWCLYGVSCQQIPDSTWARIFLSFCRGNCNADQKTNKKLSYCWETVRRESMPRIAEMDVKMTT